jgi:hypothetical protein
MWNIHTGQVHQVDTAALYDLISKLGGWISYHADIKPKPVRFAALEVGKRLVKVHSLALNDKKMAVEVIKSGPDDAIPVNIVERAERFIADKLRKASPVEPKAEKVN